MTNLLQQAILDSGPNRLCKPDLRVFAELFEDCLKGGLEAQQAFGRWSFPAHVQWCMLLKDGRDKCFRCDG